MGCAVSLRGAVGAAGGSLAYTENGAATAIDTTITLIDVDDTQIVGATVTITSALTGDVLGSVH